jgi:hypothetical protein
MPFTTLRNFIEEAISGAHTNEEIKEILDNIEQGVGLMEHEKQTAEALEGLPKVDEEDPVYLRGIGEAARQFALQFFPLLESIESAGHGKMPVCPRCRAGGRSDTGRQLHTLEEPCQLEKTIESLRPLYRKALEEVEARLKAQVEGETSPVAKALESDA